MPKYTIYVPRDIADDSGNPYTSAPNIGQAFVKAAAHAAGGATVINQTAHGFWVQGDDLCADTISVVEVVCNSSIWHYEVLPLVSKLKSDLNQRSIFVTAVNEDIIFIP